MLDRSKTTSLYPGSLIVFGERIDLAQDSPALPEDVWAATQEMTRRDSRYYVYVVEPEPDIASPKPRHRRSTYVLGLDMPLGAAVRKDLHHFGLQYTCFHRPMKGHKA